MVEYVSQKMGQPVSNRPYRGIAISFSFFIFINLTYL